jgi:hypothetical protein
MTDREFWLAIRCALLAIVAAIERKYLSDKKRADAELDSIMPCTKTF